MIDRYLTPTELRRLLSALALVLGLLALAATFAFIVVPGLRYQAFRDPAVEPVQLDTGWLDPTDYPASPRRLIPPVDPATLLTPSQALLARGGLLYAQECVTCHGPQGKGDGPGGRGLRPAPRNFSDPAGWKLGPQLEALYQTLSRGIPGSAMASFEYLPRKDRMALAHFVQTLGRPAPSDPRALAELARSFATGSETIPARIPVAKAEALLCREFRPAPPLRRPPRQAILDPRKAAQVLAGLGGKLSPETLAAQVPGNGFAPRVLTWDRETWEELCREVLVIAP